MDHVGDLFFFVDDDRVFPLKEAIFHNSFFSNVNKAYHEFLIDFDEGAKFLEFEIIS